MSIAAQAARAVAFRALHEGPAFVLPNPWDAGSARVLEDLGFAALATTSSGFAYTLGRSDGGASLDELVEHVGALTAASALPLTVDLEHGHGPDPDAPARAVTRVAAAGAVGASIEDYDPVGGTIYPVGEAVERVTAALAAARALPFPFTLTARAENLIRGVPDLDDTIARLQAYEAAGADVLYAPGLADLDQVSRLARALGKPLNVLARPDLTLDGIAAAGGRRVSVGGSLAWAALDGFAGAAERMRSRGDFSGLTGSGRIAGWSAPNG